MARGGNRRRPAGSTNTVPQSSPPPAIANAPSDLSPNAPTPTIAELNTAKERFAKFGTKAVLSNTVHSNKGIVTGLMRLKDQKILWDTMKNDFKNDGIVSQVVRDFANQFCNPNSDYSKSARTTGSKKDTVNGLSIFGALEDVFRFGQPHHSDGTQRSKNDQLISGPIADNTLKAIAKDLPLSDTHFPATDASTAARRAHVGLICSIYRIHEDYKDVFPKYADTDDHYSNPKYKRLGLHTEDFHAISILIRWFRTKVAAGYKHDPANVGKLMMRTSQKSEVQVNPYFLTDEDIHGRMNEQEQITANTDTTTLEQFLNLAHETPDFSYNDHEDVEEEDDKSIAQMAADMEELDRQIQKSNLKNRNNNTKNKTIDNMVRILILPPQVHLMSRMLN